MSELYGYITKKDTTLTEAQIKLRGQMVNALAISLQKKGDDGTGILAIANGKEYVLKSEDPAIKFIRKDSYRRIMNKNPRIVMGHIREVRWKAPANEDSYPCISSNIIGSCTKDMDSIFELLSNKKDFPKVFAEVEEKSLIATWFDKKRPDDFFVVVHDDKDFWMAEVPELDTLFYSTSGPALQYILEASVGCKNRTVTTLKEDKVYRIDQTMQLFTTEVSFAKKPEPPKVEPKNDYQARATEYQKNKTKREKRKARVLRKQGKKIVKRMKADICGYCHEKLNLFGYGGFWYDPQVKEIVCHGCMHDMKTWDEFIFMTYEDQQKLKGVTAMQLLPIT